MPTSSTLLLQRCGVKNEEEETEINLYGLALDVTSATKVIDKVNLKLTDGKRAWTCTIENDTATSNRIQIAESSGSMVNFFLDKFTTSSNNDSTFFVIRKDDIKTDKLQVKKRLAGGGSLDIVTFSLDRVKSENASETIQSILNEVFRQAIASQLECEKLTNENNKIKSAYDKSVASVEEIAQSEKDKRNELFLHFLQILNSKKQEIALRDEKVEVLEKKLKDLNDSDSDNDSENSEKISNNWLEVENSTSNASQSEEKTDVKHESEPSFSNMVKRNRESETENDQTKGMRISKKQKHENTTLSTANSKETTPLDQNIADSDSGSDDDYFDQFKT